MPNVVPMFSFSVIHAALARAGGCLLALVSRTSDVHAGPKVASWAEALGLAIS